MKRSIIQVYSALVCLVAVITFLICIGNLVSTFIDFLSPQDTGYNQISLSSYEYFKMDLLKTTTKEQFYIPSEEEIHKMYEAAKERNLIGVNHRIFKDLIVYAFVMLLSLGLFFPHWKLMKKYETD